MSKKRGATPATATGLTVKTLMGTLVVPGGVSKIDSVCGYIAGKVSLTIAEMPSGIITIESDAFGSPQEFPLATFGMLTSGLAAYTPKDWPCDIPVKEGNSIRCYITLDATYTPAFVGRVILGYS
jgi:hypothetical protein